MTTIATHEIIISVRPERLAEVEPLLSGYYPGIAGTAETSYATGIELKVYRFQVGEYPPAGFISLLRRLNFQRRASYRIENL